MRPHLPILEERRCVCERERERERERDAARWGSFTEDPALC
jgi:hypothetical protein